MAGPLGMGESEPRHLPRPRTSGEVMGWDLKKVSPAGATPWIMLLGIDFASNKAFGWDLDVDKAKMQEVQGKILRYAQENDLMAVNWSDNGGPFKNVLEEALAEAFGMQSRHIPPGHPQSNGLVEVYNRILDIAHGGCRDRLPSALLAHSNTPRPPLESPEVMWRALRPLQSRWRGLALREAIKGRQLLSDADWESFLADSYKKCNDKELCDQYEAKVKPIREAIASQRMRQQMAQRLKAKKRSDQQNRACIVSGDRVICQNNQYTTTSAGQKFQSGEYRVLSVNNGLVDIEDVETGRKVTRHMSTLKLMPKIQQPNDALSQSLAVEEVAIAPFMHSVVVDGVSYDVHWVKDDGECFFRCASMWLCASALDDGDKSHKLRQEVVSHAAQCVQKAKGLQLRTMRMHVANEMKDDPSWNTDIPFAWPRYLEYSRQRSTFATVFLMRHFVAKEGVSVIVYKETGVFTVGHKSTQMGP
jgi:hypothetical protein